MISPEARLLGAFEGALGRARSVSEFGQDRGGLHKSSGMVFESMTSAF
jgi:hypothetical protein